MFDVETSKEVSEKDKKAHRKEKQTKEKSKKVRIILDKTGSGAIHAINLFIEAKKSFNKMRL